MYHNIMNEFRGGKLNVCVSTIIKSGIQVKMECYCYPEEPAYRFKKARSQEIGPKVVSGIHKGSLSVGENAGS